MDDEGGEPRGRGWAALRPIHLDLGDVLVQVIAVALGVVLGFAVTSWSTRATERKLLRATVGNIIAEIGANQDGMRNVRREHASLATALAAFETRARRSHLVSLREAEPFVSGRPFRLNVPLAIAWQIAQNDQGLTLLPYRDRYDLAWVYEVQTIYYDAERRYENSLLTFSAAPDANYYLALADLANQARAVASIEMQLDALYTQTRKQARSEFPR